MNKAILIINANTAAAQTIKHNLTSPNTEIVCVSSMHDALQTFNMLLRTAVCEYGQFCHAAKELSGIAKCVTAFE